MALWLNKFFIALLTLIFSTQSIYSQVGERSNEKDYKDSKQFQKFHRTKQIVGAWQINELKEGALVVRLKTNKLLIDELIKLGNTALAKEKQIEQFAINKNTMFAYKDYLTFCKVYFMYSHSSDSLLKGVRNGIFLDTNLLPDPSITMTEKFYLIAERDRALSSSIGFVPEDSAQLVQERGNPIKMMAILVKNKYGHQLKGPFPYSVTEFSFDSGLAELPLYLLPYGRGGMGVTIVINRKIFSEPDSIQPRQKEKINRLPVVRVKKEFTYGKLSERVQQFNDNLFATYKKHPKPDINRIDQKIRPFLY